MPQMAAKRHLMRVVHFIVVGDCGLGNITVFLFALQCNYVFVSNCVSETTSSV